MRKARNARAQLKRKQKSSDVRPWIFLKQLVKQFYFYTGQGKPQRFPNKYLVHTLYYFLILHWFNDFLKPVCKCFNALIKNTFASCVSMTMKHTKQSFLTSDLSGFWLIRCKFWIKDYWFKRNIIKGDSKIGFFTKDMSWERGIGEEGAGVVLLWRLSSNKISSIPARF